MSTKTIPAQTIKTCDRCGVTAGEPVAWHLDGTEHVEFVKADYHDGSEWTALTTAPPPQAVREPLSTIDLMRVVMDADNETRGFALRGTTNWASHIGKAVQNAVLGITKGDTNAPSN